MICQRLLDSDRSSLFKCHGLIMANSIGIIDNSYCGENDECVGRKASDKAGASVHKDEAAEVVRAIDACEFVSWAA